MEKRKRESISSRLWQDTGKELGGKKLYISVLGHYALESDEVNLMGVTGDQLAKGGIHVDKSGS